MTEQEMLDNILWYEGKIEELKTLSKDYEAEKERLRAELLKEMQNTGVKKWEHGIHEVLIGKSGGGVKHTDDLDAIPKQFIREKIERSVDKKKLREYLESNAFKPNWASIEDGVPTLVIRVKS